MRIPMLTKRMGKPRAVRVHGTRSGCAVLASLAVGMVATILAGCSPRTPTPAAPPSLRLSGGSSHTTGVGAPLRSETVVTRGRSLPQSGSQPIGSSPRGTRETVTPSSTAHLVNKPVLSQTHRLDPWHVAFETQLELDRDVDEWIRSTGRLISRDHLQQLLVLRRIHGTGGFLRQADRYVAEHSDAIPEAARQSLSGLRERWNQFEDLLAKLNAAQALAQQDPQGQP